MTWGAWETGRPGARIVPIPNLKGHKMTLTLQERLDQLITDARSELFTERYRSTATEPEILGIMLACHFKWDGRACFETLTHALEDSNFHSTNAALRLTWECLEGEA